MYLGIDVGSTFIKAVAIDQGEIYFEKTETGWNPRVGAEHMVAELLEQCQKTKGDVSYSVTTGYGRGLYPSNEQITEITCHAKGSAYLFHDIDFIIDVGGQDCKVIKVNHSGKVLDFIMNDKCAAGTGKFLQVMAERLGMDMKVFAEQANFKQPSQISSMCTVFAESEIIGLIASGENIDNIIGGIYQSIAKRIYSMAIKFKEGKGVLVGGGANCNALKTALEMQMGMELEIHRHSEFAGAIGAALIAKNNNENMNKTS
ncbi:MAG: acyl-CoA dehydratase activase [Eubacteriales bacterium]